MKSLISLVVLSLVLFSCDPSVPKPELAIGKWRGEFFTAHNTIPFNFSVEDDTAGIVKVFLLNGEERFALDSVRYEKDSVIIPIDVYDTQLRAQIEGDSLIGYFKKNQVAGRGILFKAARNQEFRFKTRSDKSVKSFARGIWSAIIESNGKKKHIVGKFGQQENRVTGTFLTITGDYRFLDGIVDGDSLKLSAFSGSNPSLLTVKFSDSLHFSGEYISSTGKSKIEAVKSDTAKLPDPYALTYLKSKQDKFTFSFPDLEGKTVSLEDEKYKGKVVVVTILGSWCPNCLDEAAFFSPWYKQNKKRGIEIVGLSFERKDDPAFAKKRLEKFIKRFDIRYDILFAGLSDKEEASKKLPSLNAVLAFPTTIIVDRSGNVSKIHTGFSGPATGELYDEFVKEFNLDIDAVAGAQNLIP